VLKQKSIFSTKIVVYIIHKILYNIYLLSAKIKMKLLLSVPIRRIVGADV